MKCWTCTLAARCSTTLVARRVTLTGLARCVDFIQPLSCIYVSARASRLYGWGGRIIRHLAMPHPAGSCRCASRFLRASRAASNLAGSHPAAPAVLRVRLRGRLYGWGGRIIRHLAMPHPAGSCRCASRFLRASRAASNLAGSHPAAPAVLRVRLRGRLYGWGGRIRTCGTRDQNPMPYRLATPHLTFIVFVHSNPAAARKDSNLRDYRACGTGGSKPDALPLGYAPSNFIVFVRSNPAAARKDSNLRESRKLSSPARRPRIFLTASAGVNSRRIRRRR